MEALVIANPFIAGLVLSRVLTPSPVLNVLAGLALRYYVRAKAADAVDAVKRAL